MKLGEYGLGVRLLVDEAHLAQEEGHVAGVLLALAVRVDVQLPATVGRLAAPELLRHDVRAVAVQLHQLLELVDAPLEARHHRLHLPAKYCSHNTMSQNERTLVSWCDTTSCRRFFGGSSAGSNYNDEGLMYSIPRKKLLDPKTDIIIISDLPHAHSHSARIIVGHFDGKNQSNAYYLRELFTLSLLQSRKSSRKRRDLLIYFGSIFKAIHFLFLPPTFLQGTVADL